MDKESLLIYAKHLHMEAFHANCYLSVLKQHRENCDKYPEEMKLSFTYYAVTYNAIIDALYLNLAKLYESDNKAMGIKKLLNYCVRTPDLFPPERTYSVPGFREGETIELVQRWEHEITPDEECFFQEEVSLHNFILAFLRDSDIPAEALAFLEESVTPAVVQLSREKLSELYNKKYRSMSKEIERLRRMRNKIYIHNDAESILDIETVRGENALDIECLQKLVDFVLDVCIFVIKELSGTNELRIHPYIDDWADTLERLHNKDNL